MIALPDGAAAILGNIAERSVRLQEIRPQAVELAALVTFEIHQVARGEIGDLAGDHTPDYRRKQLDGRRALHLEDLDYLALRHVGIAAILAQHFGEIARAGHNTASEHGSLAREEALGAALRRARGKARG